MKRIIPILLILILMLFAFISCGDESAETATATQTQTVTEDVAPSSSGRVTTSKKLGMGIKEKDEGWAFWAAY